MNTDTFHQLFPVRLIGWLQRLYTPVPLLLHSVVVCFFLLLFGSAVGAWADRNSLEGSTPSDEGFRNIYFQKSVNHGNNCVAGARDISCPALHLFEDFYCNPVLVPENRAYKGCVIFDSNSFSGHGDSTRYKAYYSKYDGTGYYIGYATSGDGLSWSGDTDAGLGYGKTWTRVVYDAGGFGGSGSYYKMWYCDLSTSPYSIGHAYSADGLTWTDYGIVIDGPLEGQNMFDLCVLYQPGGVTSGTEYANYRYIGYASKTESVTFYFSPDGITWYLYGLLTNQALNPSVLRLDTNDFRMWASASGAAAGSNNIRIDYYTSTDGLTWSPISQPVPGIGTLGGAGSWNEIRNYAPSVIYNGTTLQMWRTGRDSSGTYSIGATNDLLTFDLSWDDSDSDSQSATYEMIFINAPGSCDKFNPTSVTIPAGYSISIGDYLTAGDICASGTLDTFTGGVGSSGNVLSFQTSGVDHTLTIISSSWGTIGEIVVLDPTEISDGAMTFTFDPGYEISPDTIAVFTWLPGVIVNSSLCQDYTWSGQATGLSSGAITTSPYSACSLTQTVVDGSPPIFAGLASAGENPGLRSITLDWSDAVDKCSPPVTYNIYRSTAGCAAIDLGTIYQAASEISFTDENLTVGQTYSYIVRSEDSAGFEETNTVCISVTVTQDPTMADCNGWNDMGSIFTPEPPNTKAYYETVIFDGNDQFSGNGAAWKYKMWFSGSSGIAHVGSDDGINWTRIAASETGLTNAHHARVTYDPGGFQAGIYFYKIWYWDTSNLYTINSIRTAESSDGVNWVNDQVITQEGSSVVSGIHPDWNRGSYGPVHILYSQTGPGTVDHSNIMSNRYVMYYDGTTGGNEQTGLAYSVNGVHWYGYNGGIAPVLPMGATGEWDDSYATYAAILKNPQGYYEMWYSGGTTAAHQGIGYATSTDGISWSKCSNNPIQSIGGGANQGGLCPPGTFCETRNYTPSVLFDTNLFGEHPDCGSLYRMWRTGADSSGTRTIGFAVSNMAYVIYPTPADVGNSLRNSKNAPNVRLSFSDTSADHYHIYRGTAPDFMLFSPPVNTDYVTDIDGGTPGIQWEDSNAHMPGSNYFYKVYSADPCHGESSD